MTEQNSAPPDHPEPARTGNASYAVGYGRPPKATQFKEGQSGNPKGRPKGSRSVKSQLAEVYTGKIAIHAGTRRYSVMRLEALLLKQLERGIKGSERAARDAIANAKILGVLDEIEPDNAPRGDYLTDETLEALSDQALQEYIKINEAREAKRANKS